MRRARSDDGRLKAYNLNINMGCLTLRPIFTLGRQRAKQCLVKHCRLITYWPARSMLTHFRRRDFEEIRRDFEEIRRDFEEIRDAHRPSSETWPRTYGSIFNFDMVFWLPGVRGPYGLIIQLIVCLFASFTKMLRARLRYKYQTRYLRLPCAHGPSRTASFMLPM